MNLEEFQRLSDLERDYWWHRGRRAIIRRLLRRPQSPGGGWIADVGCGTGGNLQVLEHFGAVLSVDPIGPALVLAREAGCTRTIQASADSLPLARDSMTRVVMLDVIEHIDDERAVLAECVRVLRPGGQLLLTVPAYQWLWSGHDEALGHKRRYVRGDLVAKLRAAGLEVVFSSYVITFVFPLFASYRIFERALRHRQASSYVAVPAAIDWLFTALLRFEGWLVEYGVRLPFGTSIVTLARKSSR
jgi:SAM-dependent methyltransferase